MQIIQKKLADIVPYARNTKKHDETQIKNVAESIKKYGWVQPIVIDNDGTIVIGHCRALAAERLGMEEVPCVVVSDLTEEEINALRIVDNKTNESPWDFDLLSAELPEIDLSLKKHKNTKIRRAQMLKRIAKALEICAKISLAR